jgi:hypothetical protein
MTLIELLLGELCLASAKELDPANQSMDIVSESNLKHLKEFVNVFASLQIIL